MMVPKMSAWLSVAEFLEPETVLPTQFHEAWHRPAPITPERALVLSVLWRAIEDLYKNRFARRRRDQSLYAAAYKWVASNDQSWPYSFVNICEALSLDPVSVRRELLGEMAPAPRRNVPRPSTSEVSATA
jgi:hypothetical protein